MIIVNQNKDKIINFEAIKYIDFDNETSNKNIFAYIGDSNQHSFIFLGKYKTKERAKEVLKEIANRYADVSMSNIIENLGITIHDRDFGGNASSVYEMPKE